VTPSRHSGARAWLDADGSPTTRDGHDTHLPSPGAKSRLSRSSLPGGHHTRCKPRLSTVYARFVQAVAIEQLSCSRPVSAKTWLAMFDYTQLREELGLCPRLLSLAHPASCCSRRRDLTAPPPSFPRRDPYGGLVRWQRPRSQRGAGLRINREAIAA
jgi:hypothetical protein